MAKSMRRRPTFLIIPCVCLSASLCVCLCLGHGYGHDSHPQVESEWPPEGTQCTKGPCGPGNDICTVGSPTRFVFHLSDVACDINDPNGPFYDPVHKVYHNFYQDHLAEANPVGMKAGAGPDWGHWVSRDFLHWARLPVAIWNDKWFDNAAIFTGSTTIVDGKPVIVYPGRCTGGPKGSPEAEACSTGFTYSVAVPADPSDPLYTNWAKPSYNPVVNQTGDDPSSAWKTPAGEWRFIGNQKCGDGNGAPIYGSMDFKSFYKIGCTTFLKGDCPTFFPLPPLVPGINKVDLEKLGPLPTHVHKAGSGNDQVQVGVWTDGKPGPAAQGGTPGRWVQQGESIPLDNGATHASKDFFDPVKQRRIMWVWARITGGAQTVPREMTYDPRTGRIVYNPVAEMTTLRSESPIGSLAAQTISSLDAAVFLKGGLAADIEIVWKRPTANASLQASIADVVVGMDYVVNASTMRVYCGNYHDAVPMLDAGESDEFLSLRLMVDTAVAEAYFQNGRVAITFPITLKNESDGNVALTVKNVNTTSTGGAAATNAVARLEKATSWSMSSIWTTANQVIATPPVKA